MKTSFPLFSYRQSQILLVWCLGCNASNTLWKYFNLFWKQKLRTVNKSIIQISHSGGHSLKVIIPNWYFPNFKVTVQYGAGFKIKRHIIELLFKCINDATGGHLYPIKYQWKTIINSYFFREKKRWGDYIQIKTSLNIH